MTEISRRRYTPDEVRQALEIHASVNGREDLVGKLLKDSGLTMTTATVRDWATRRHRDEYADVRQGIQTHIRINASDRFKATTSRALDVVDESLRQIGEALKRGEIDPKNLPKVAQQAAVSAGISVDKSQLLDGEPTEIVGATGDMGDLIRSLGAVGMTMIVGGVNVTAQANDPNLTTIDVQSKRPALVRGDDQDDDGKIDVNPGDG